MNLLPQFSTRAIKAALRLAGFYAVCVTVLVVALVVSLGGFRDIVRDLGALALPAGICFAVAFLLLLLARRLGFTALWLALLALWALASFRNPGPGPVFVLWSLFAAPLFLMVQLGFRSVADKSASVGLMTSLFWITLAIAGVLFRYPLDLMLNNEPWWVRLMSSVLTAAWWIAPAAITAVAIRQIHAATPAAIPSAENG
jgi:hypothetical protein